MAQTLREPKRIKPASPKVPSDRVSRQKTKEKRKLKAKETILETPPTALFQKQVEPEQFLAPHERDAPLREKENQLLPQAGTFADQMEEKAVRSLTNVKDLFYAQKRKGVDKHQEMVEEGTQRPLGRFSPVMKKASPEEDLHLETTQESLSKMLMASQRGIRYRFVFDTQESKGFSGERSKLRLAIESNISGYLYVLANLANGKWQMMSSDFLNVPRFSDGSIQVKPYKPVMFTLSQLSQTSDKSADSFLIVLLSSIPITNLGNWLGKENLQKHFVERFGEAPGQDVFIIDPTSKSEKPFRVDIPLP